MHLGDLEKSIWVLEKFGKIVSEKGANPGSCLAKAQFLQTNDVQNNYQFEPHAKLG